MAVTAGVPLVYLCGPIDDITAEQAAGWRDAATDFLLAAGIGAYNPVRAFTLPPVLPREGRPVSAINRVAVSQSSAVLANLSGPGRAFGSIREIEYARGLGVPVFVAAPTLASLEAWDVLVSATIEEAATATVRRLTGWAP